MEEIKKGTKGPRHAQSIEYNDKVFRNESYIKKFTRVGDDTMLSTKRSQPWERKSKKAVSPSRSKQGPSRSSLQMSYGEDFKL